MSDQIADRKAKLEKMRALGVDPYGGRFTGVTPNAAIRAAAEMLKLEAGQVSEDQRANFKAAGRVVLYRDIGSLIFMTIRDWTGDIQYGLSKKMVTEGWELAKLLDLGDIVGAEGRLGHTKTRELTLWVTKLTMLSKALRPPPEKRLGLTDVEARYRRRHVDLYSSPGSQQVFLQRAKIINYAREVLRQRGFIEVDTPVLQPIYGGAAARPFLTHHNTLDMGLYLGISPELYLKRCLIGGLERVFEFSRCFRNEGISPRHNPEFTMLELYQAYADYHDMMEICEAIIGGAACDVIGSCRIPVDRHAVETLAREGEAPAEPGSAGASPSPARIIDYSTPWPRLRYADLFREHVGIAIDDMAATRKRARELEYGEARMDDAVVVHTLFEHYVEDKLINPTFVLDWPAPICPLTKRHPDDPNLALRFELFINGMEIGNAYSELNDPAIQRDTLSRHLRGEEEETMAVMDEDFVEALECGMPPAGGLGIGIDRTVMLLTGSPSIRDVILFPLQRPQRQESDEETEQGRDEETESRRDER
jgi:lysyl-tRNA synthetase class 2